MQNIAVFRKVANMSTFCISAQNVRVSLRKSTKVAVNDFVGCIWMQTKNFTPKNYSELQRHFRIFLRNDPRLPYLMSSGSSCLT